MGVNQTFLAWTGYRAEDLVMKKRFVELLGPGGRLYHETHFAPLLRIQGFVREIALELIAADDERLPALLNAIVRTHGPGISDGIVRMAIFAAPDRRGYEQELLRARRRAEESEARARTLAETLQASLIPPTPPRIPNLDIGAAFRPAGDGTEVGGDFYDVFQLADGVWAVVIGDVQGKGAKAAAVTALARYTIRAAAMQVKEPRLVLSTLNEAMLRQRIDAFCTVAYARIAPENGATSVMVAAGGHPLPIHVSGERSPEPVGEPGTLVGVLADPIFHDNAVRLGPGDGLVFYTDGVTEARRGLDLFGESRLVDILRTRADLNAPSMADGVVQAALDFQGGFAKDDIAVVAVKSA